MENARQFRLGKDVRKSGPSKGGIIVLGVVGYVLLGLGLGWEVSSQGAETPETAAVSDAMPAEASDFTGLDLEALMKVKVPTVYGASKREQKVTEAPSAVSIVTSEEIQRFGHRTLADILRSVRGLYVSYDRLYGYIGVRGFNRPGDFGGRILVLVDGHRLNEPLYDSAFNVTDFIVDVDLIERVEVIRGPGSTLYGNNAFFGVINVVTRRGREVGGAEVSGAMASYDAYQGRVTYGNLFKNGLEWMVSGTLHDSEGRRRVYVPAHDTARENNGVAEHLDEDKFQSLATTLSYGQFTLRGGFIAREKETPFAPFGTLFNAQQAAVDTRAFADLGFAGSFGEEWDATGRLYYDYYKLNNLYPFDADPEAERPVLGVNKELNTAQWAGVEGQVSRPIFDRHRLTLGADARHDFSLNFLSYDKLPERLLITDSSEDSSRIGLFLQDEIRVREDLSLNAGVRYDHYSTFGNTVNPRAGLIYNPWAKTVFKLLYGEAYRAPNLYESSFESFYQKGNAALEPETIRTYEFVYEQYLPANLRFGFSGFFNQTKGLISQSTDPGDGLLFYENVDQAETRGLEWELEYRGASGFLGRLSHTLQRTRDEGTGKELSNSPRHLVKAGIAAPVWGERLTAGLEAQYSSRADALPGRGVRSADAFWTANFTLYSRNLARGLDLSASIYNLFDERYAYPASDEYRSDVLAQDGRTFRVKFTYRF